MRVIPAISLLGVGLALAAPGWAGSSKSSEPLHLVTCASSRVAREYDEGLRAYYSGRIDDAIKDFQDAARRDPTCAMAHWGLSRTLHKKGSAPEALAAINKAKELDKGADDREQRLIRAWKRFLEAQSKPDAERKGELNGVRQDLDHSIALYSHDAEMWLERAAVAESPLRATPFNLAALNVRPDHPFGKSWSRITPAAPQLAPTSAASAPQQATRASGNPTTASPPPPLVEGLGKLSHPITTKSPAAQAHYEQGLRCWHAYVTPMRNKVGAGANFLHATTLDPECAMAYWGLSLCVQQGDVMTPIAAASRAQELAFKNGTDKERRFCSARVLELESDLAFANYRRLLGAAQASTTDKERLQTEARAVETAARAKREEFLDALDGAIAAYPDDVELWIWRGKTHGVGVSAIPFQLAAHRMHPEHPSPNHEMIHAYEGIDRPALGWQFTQGFRNSAPNMPHANHMQAHLAMRLGRWQEAIDCGRAARKMSLAGYPELDAGHHIDILMRALAHEGRFTEAEAEPRAYRDGLPWARLLQLKGIPDELDAWVERRKNANAVDAYYVGAIARLDRNDLPGTEPMLAKVEEQWKKQPANIYRYNEIKGRYLVQSGQVDEGLKLLREAGAKAVKDSGLHAWGGGSYILEVWGEAALRAHRLDEAEEAFHEALAHEHGSILGALGMQVVWETRGRLDMAEHYSARAGAIWRGADAGALRRQLERMRKLAGGGTVAARSAGD